MKKIAILIIILFVAAGCTKRIAIGPELSELPFPMEGDKEIIDRSIQDSLTRSWRFFQRGNLEDATYNNRKALQKSLKIAPLWVMEGYINLAKGDVERARNNFMAAKEIQTDYPTALNALALMAFIEKDYPSAYEQYKKLAALYPDFPSAKIKSDIATLKAVDYYKLKADKAVQSNKYKEAIENYKLAIVLSPTIWELHYNLSLIYLELKDYENALVYLQLSNNLNPHSKKVKELLADSLFKTGKYSQALEHYKDLAFSEPQAGQWNTKINECQRMIDFLKLPAEFRDAEKSDRISRAVFAAYLIFKIPVLTTIPPKTHIILTDISSHWAKEYIILAVNRNLMGEFPNYTFEPHNYVKRSDLAYCIDKLLDFAKEINKDIDFANANTNVEFSDVPSEYSKYHSIQRAVSLGFMDMNDKTQFKPENNITGEELLKAVNKIALLFPNKNKT